VTVIGCGPLHDYDKLVKLLSCHPALHSYSPHFALLVTVCFSLGISAEHNIKSTFKIAHD
jgi:hypothetical protein